MSFDVVVSVAVAIDYFVRDDIETNGGDLIREHLKFVHGEEVIEAIIGCDCPLVADLCDWVSQIGEIGPTSMPAVSKGRGAYDIDESTLEAGECG